MALGAVSLPKDICKAMVRNLEDYAGINNPETLNPLQYGTTAALRASATQAGALSVDLSSLTEPYTAGATSNNRLGIKYKVRRCDDTVDTSLDPCDDDSNGINPWVYEDFLFTTPVSHSFTIDKGTMRRYCESYSEQYAMLLKEAYDTLKRKANARFISQLGANLGSYYALDCSLAADSGTDTASIAFVDSNGNPNGNGIFRIKQQYERMGFQGMPLVIGGSEVSMVMHNQRLYAGNTNGMDLNKIDGVQWFKDFQLDGTLANGLSNVLSLAPGSAQILQWNRFTGEHAHASQTLVKTTLDLGRFFGEPAGQFVVDHSVYVKECVDGDVQYIHKFYLYTDLLMLKAAMLNTTDCNLCGNGILLWDHDCADPNCTDLNPEILAP